MKRHLGQKNEQEQSKVLALALPGARVPACRLLLRSRAYGNAKVTCQEPSLPFSHYTFSQESGISKRWLHSIIAQLLPHPSGPTPIVELVRSADVTCQLSITSMKIPALAVANQPSSLGQYWSDIVKTSTYSHEYSRPIVVQTSHS